MKLAALREQLGDAAAAAAALERAMWISPYEPTLHEKLASFAARAGDHAIAVRERRVHPGKDDKVIVAWNGLMIDALARGGTALGAAASYGAIRVAGERKRRFARRGTLAGLGRPRVKVRPVCRRSP